MIGSDASFALQRAATDTRVSMTGGAAAAGAALPTPRLALRDIAKSFGGIHALRGVSFEVQAGEIHTLVGENGAGKSTLVKIITGLQEADSGQVLVDDVERHFRSPVEARAAGVVAVYQDPKLFPHLDVAENIFMGLHPTSRLGTVDRRQMYGRARDLLAALDVDLAPTTIVAGLSVAELQFIELARAMSSEGDRLLILDEPTAALTPSETERLFTIVRRLRDGGTAVILISHRLEELTGLADTVTILRDGTHVVTTPAREIDQAGIVRLMVGRSLDSLYATDGGAPARGAAGVTGAARAARVDARGQATRAAGTDERLRVDGLSQRGVFEDVSFALHAGEIVGMAGLVGAGRTEIAQTIFGIMPPTGGHVHLDGRAIRVRSPRQMLRLGLAYLPEDRDGLGLITAFSITLNIVLPLVNRLARVGVLRRRRERDLARRLATDLQIKARSLDQAVSALSGGNRQKVVLGKWLAMNPKILILDEPTHGIDIGTKAQVHGIIARLAAEGMAILLISSDLPEVLTVSDRILVIAEGRLTKEFSRREATQESVMLAATAYRYRAAEQGERP